jgi:hypothetical protein
MSARTMAQEDWLVLLLTRGRVAPSLDTPDPPAIMHLRSGAEGSFPHGKAQTHHHLPSACSPEAGGIRREALRDQVVALMDRIQGRTGGMRPADIRRTVREAVESARLGTRRASA